MDATTLKLPPALKKRVGSLARREGKTPHAWMVETLKRETARAESHEQMIEAALAAAKDIDDGGPVFAADEVHDYVLAKAGGRAAKRPRPLAKRRSR